MMILRQNLRKTNQFVLLISMKSKKIIIHQDIDNNQNNQNINYEMIENDNKENKNEIDKNVIKETENKQRKLQI